MNKIFYLTAVILFFAACSSNPENAENENTAEAAEAPKVSFVEVTELEPVVFEHFIETQGTIESDNNIWVTPKSSGEILNVNFHEGDWVKKGQLLVKLDDEILQKTIVELEASLEFVTTIFEKQKALWDQNIGTEVQYLTAKNNKESLENKLVTVKEQLELSKVKAPISGYVDDVKVKAGEIAMPGMPVMRVVNLSELKVKAQVSETYAAKIKKGQAIKVIFSDLDATVNAKISYVGQVVDPLNRTFSIIAKFPKSKLPIKPNMVAQVKVLDFRKDDAISIPVNVIQKTQEGSYVYVAKKEGGDYIAERRFIEKDLTYNGKVLVKEGLSSGEKVITFGFQDLKDGGFVKF